MELTEAGVKIEELVEDRHADVIEKVIEIGIEMVEMFVMQRKEIVEVQIEIESESEMKGTKEMKRKEDVVLETKPKKHPARAER